jgi:hypothetical protein
VRAVAQAILSPPRYTSHARTNACGECGCRAMRMLAKANMVGEATAKCSRLVHRGCGGGTHVQTRRLNWGPSLFPPVWVGWLDSECISCRVEERGADEVVVSDDPAGQHNPLASQGPLDRIVLGPFLLNFPSRGGLDRKVHYRWKANKALTAYKSRCFPGIATKVVVQFLFEAVLGKTRRTDLRDITPPLSQSLDPPFERGGSMGLRVFNG